MKLILLLLLISCGNNQPSPHYYGLNTPLKSEGRFELVNDKSFYPYTLQADIEKRFFQEFFKINKSYEFNNEFQIITIPDLDLSFEYEKGFLLRLEKETRPLFYLENNFVKPLPLPEFLLSKHEVQMLNKKKGFLAFKVNERRDFKKVMILEGDTLKSFFIPLTDTVSAILAKEVSLTHIFHGSDYGRNWYKRETPNGNLLYIFSDLHSLKLKFLNEASRSTDLILREEGRPKMSKVLKKGFHFLKLSPKRYVKEVRMERRSFKPSQYYSKFPVYTTLSKSEVPVSFDDIEKELNYPFSTRTDFKYTLASDSNGFHWYVSFFLDEDTDFSFHECQPETFYAEGFSRSNSVKNLNLEAKFGLEIQSYLEPSS